MRTILKEKAHFRNVRESHARNTSRVKYALSEDRSSERELQSFLHDTLVKVSGLGSSYFLVAWVGGFDQEGFDAYTQLFNKCLKGRWHVTVVDDVDGEGVPGWRINQL